MLIVLDELGRHESVSKHGLERYLTRLQQRLEAHGGRYFAAVTEIEAVDYFKHGIATVPFIGGQPNLLCNGAPHSRMLHRSKTTLDRDC